MIVVCCECSVLWYIEIVVLVLPRCGCWSKRNGRYTRGLSGGTSCGLDGG